MLNKKLLRCMFSQIMTGALVCMLSLQVYAKADANLMQYHSKEDKVQLYLTGMDGVSALNGQIGRKEAEVELISETPSKHSVILIDNSLSITKSNQEKIQNVISQYVQQKPEGEIVSVAVYGEDITYLAERETDAQKIIDAMSQIVYENQDSYLTDILYEEIKRLDDNTEYTRFIVATDGVDNKAIGYTKEELTTLLEKENYPVYALGCIYKDNSSELENLFALSRLTNAKHYLLDEYEEFTEIVSGLSESVTQLSMYVPEEYRDGSRQNVLLTFETENGVEELSFEMNMPFQVEKSVVEEAPAETVVIEKVVETVVETVIIEKTMEESVEEPAEGGTEVDIVTIGAVALLVVAVVALLIIQKNNKNKNKEKPVKKDKKVKKENIVPETVDVNKTQILSEALPEADSDFTILLSNKEADYKVVIQDINDKMRVFSYPLIDNSVIVGRSSEAGAQIALNYNNSISKKHCKISNINGRFFVEDLGSANGTWVNGLRINARTEFNNGAKLKFGNLEVVVSVEKLD